MEDKNLDREIKNSLLTGSEPATEMKEEIWKNIERQLAIAHQDRYDLQNQQRGEMNMTRRTLKKGKRRTKAWVTGTIAAAVLLGVLSTSTNTGQAFINNIKEYFAPQKNVVEDIEGMPEEKEVSLKEGRAGYIIYIDEERYTVKQENGVDKIVPKVPLGEAYPDVFMEITQDEETAPEQVAEAIYHQLKDEYETVREVTEVNEPIKGYVVSAIDGSEWDSPIARYYVVSNEKQGSFIIHQQYFLEAEEGHGARFDYMVKEFKIVDNPEQ